MGRYVEGQDRTQSTLFPERLDDWIHEDSTVRIVDVLIGLTRSEEARLWSRQSCSDRVARVQPGDAAQELRLRLPQPGAVEPEA